MKNNESYFVWKKFILVKGSRKITKFKDIAENHDASSLYKIETTPMVYNICFLYVCHIFYSVVVNILSFTIKLNLYDSIVTNEQ